MFDPNPVVTGMSFFDADESLNEDEKNSQKSTVTAFARLQRQSPMTSTIACNRYRTNHRVLGNIVNALINLQKYTVSRLSFFVIAVLLYFESEPMENLTCIHVQIKTDKN